MPSVYSYRHVELDKVGRGKRVIQPPGGQTADIFGSRSEASYSSASSQAGSDIASSRVHIETDSHQQLVDGMIKPANGQVSPDGSTVSATSGRQSIPQQQPLLMADDFKPIQQQQQQQPEVAIQQGGQAIQQPINIQQQKLIQMQQNDVNRSPKKTIPVLRRNPITGEVYNNPSDRQQATVRVRQPPGGRSSGIF